VAHVLVAGQAAQRGVVEARLFGARLVNLCANLVQVQKQKRGEKNMNYLPPNKTQITWHMSSEERSFRCRKTANTLSGRSAGDIACDHGWG